MIVPVISAFNKIQLTYFSGDLPTLPLDLTIGKNRKDIHCTHIKQTWILARPIPCPPKGVKNSKEPCHSAI